MIQNWLEKNSNYEDALYHSRLKGEAVERADTYKYLGVMFDIKLNWKENIKSVLKKLNSRMYCVRKLRSFGVNSDMLVIFL